MLVSCNWLKDYIDLKLSPAELADRLNIFGLPVEKVEERNSGVSGVVAAKILAVEKHPNADNLSLVDVTDGKEQLKIVCGARNIAPGQIVPLAKDGASLPGGVIIKKTKIRGAESSGMLCSSKELGIDDSHAGILILDPETHKPGEPFVPYSPDTIIHLEITPNRPDLLCMTGVARFIASITGEALKYPSCEIKKDIIDTTLDIHAKLKVDNRSAERCPRYTARLIEGVTVKESPSWLKDRLAAAGVRPINNVVDATNYVMLEINQPLHAFDYDKIKTGNIIVRTAVNGEKITALDGKTYKLMDTDLVIADPREPIAIAGVMGGGHFSMTPDSRSVVLESAYFSPKSVRKTSRALGLSSDSSYRFERGIDIDAVDAALNRAAALIISIAGGMASRNIIDIYPQKREPFRITLRFDRVNRLLGTSFTEKEAFELLKKINFTVSGKKNGSVTVEVPAYRSDIQQEIDLIEDMAQVYGYNNIPLTMPVSALTAGSEPATDAFIKEVQKTMSGFGFSEVINYSFLNNRLLKVLKEGAYSPENAVPLKNPFNEEETRMKTTLIPDLIKNLVFNRNNENTGIHLFETANVYFNNAGSYSQAPMIAAITCGHVIKPAHNHVEFLSDFTWMKSVISALFSLLKCDSEPVYEPLSGRPFYEFCAGISVNGRSLGTAGQLNEELIHENKLKHKAYMFELDAAALLGLMSPGLRYSVISRFPPVKRDLSIIVGSGVPAAKIGQIIRSGTAGLVKSLDLYDLYRGGQVPEGYKSMTYSIIFQSAEKTLSDDDVNREMDGIVNKLKAEVKAELRS